MKYLSTSNQKLAQSGIASWGIPAYQSADGFRTCPGAKACAIGCYARNGRYVMSNVKNAQERRLKLARGDSQTFIDTICNEIVSGNVKRLRIHDSGDFFSREYLNNWLAIIARNPQVQFYAYTKMLPLFRGRTMPRNFTVIYSEGGKWDSQINPKFERHSRVFRSLEDLKRAGYADASKVDLHALGKNHKIGLIYHGSKAKTWATG